MTCPPIKIISRPSFVLTFFRFVIVRCYRWMNEGGAVWYIIFFSLPTCNCFNLVFSKQKRKENESDLIECETSFHYWLIARRIIIRKLFFFFFSLLSDEMHIVAFLNRHRSSILSHSWSANWSVSEDILFPPSWHTDELTLFVLSFFS